MPRAPRRCTKPGCDQLIPAGRDCPSHPNVSPTSRASWQRSERRRRTEAVAAWVKVNGWNCPGWLRDPHPSRDLTAAHSTAVTNGGASSILTVLCRSCNSRQGTTSS